MRVVRAGCRPSGAAERPSVASARRPPPVGLRRVHPGKVIDVGTQFRKVVRPPLLPPHLGHLGPQGGRLVPPASPSTPSSTTAAAAALMTLSAPHWAIIHVNLQGLLSLVLGKGLPVVLHVMHPKLLLGVENPLLRVLVLAVLVSAIVVRGRKVVGEVGEVLIVHILVWPRLLAKEALQVLGLHVAVELLVRVEVLLAELARGVTLEPGLCHGALGVPPLVVSVELGTGVQNLLVYEDLAPPKAHVAHEFAVHLLQVGFERLHRVELHPVPLLVANGARQRTLHVHLVSNLLVVETYFGTRLHGEQGFVLDS